MNVFRIAWMLCDPMIVAFHFVFAKIFSSSCIQKMLKIKSRVSRREETDMYNMCKLTYMHLYIYRLHSIRRTCYERFLTDHGKEVRQQVQDKFVCRETAASLLSDARYQETATIMYC